MPNFCHQQDVDSQFYHLFFCYSNITAALTSTWDVVERFLTNRSGVGELFFDSFGVAINIADAREALLARHRR